MPRDAPPDGPEPAGAGDDASLLWAQIEALRSADAAQQLALEGLAATIQVQVEALRSADAAQQLALEGLAAALEDQVQSLRGADTAQRRALDGLASSLQERVDPLTARRRGAAATQLVGATPASRRRGRSGDRGLSDRLSWPPGRPRVLVTQAWLANAGDAAIAVALDGMLRAISPEASILHAAFQHDSVGPLIPGLSFVPPLEELLGTPWAPPAPGWEERGAALVESADLVLAQGGGYLVEGYQPWSRIAALAAVAHRGLPIGLVGVTVEPFRSEAARGFLRELLSVAALVDVRDEPSLEVVTDLGAVGATLGTDLALALFPRQPSAGERRGVGVVLTDHSPLVGQRSRVAALAASVLAETARATPGEQLTLWSTVQGLPEVAGEDDGAVAAEAAGALPASDRSRVEIKRGYLTPQQACALAASPRALVSMRLHPFLLAVASGTPAGLILGGQRADILAGTALLERVADPTDAESVRRVVARALEPTAPLDLWEALLPLRRRLDETRGRLAGFLAAHT